MVVSRYDVDLGMEQMTESTTWSDEDRAWHERYRRSITGRHVPADVLAGREAELLEAVQRAGVPAEELLGDAAVLAAEDVADLATVEEEVRTSAGGDRVRPSGTPAARWWRWPPSRSCSW